MPLPVAEIFGPTLQGEGPYAGRVADFVRFGGCNLACSWCDTAYTWDSTRYRLREEITDKSADQIMDELSGRSSVVVLTGGEPMLYATRPDFHDLLQQLRAQGRAVHVETNGTLVPPDESRGLIAVYVVSPKLSNAGTHRGRQDPTFHPSWVEIATQQEVHLKYVCESAKDVETAVVHASTNGWRDRERIWVMPQASNTAELAMRWPEIATEAAKVGVNATSRLHLLAWGTERRH